MIDLTEMLSVNDITNDCKAADNHFKTGLNLEDVKEEYTSDAVDENCDIVETNYEGIKEDDIKIEEIELDKLIKNEAFSSCSDAGTSFSLEQRLQFENETSQMQDIFSEDHVDLLEQYTKSDYGKYIVNIGNSNSSMICAESCTKQDNDVTKSSEIVNSLELKNSLPTAMWQCQINERGIGKAKGLFHDCRVILTRMDGSSAHEIDINNCPNYLNCGTSDLNVNFKNNNATVTESEAKLSRAALWNSNRFNDVSSQHSDSFSAQVKNQELGIISQFVDIIAEKPYKCNLCDYASCHKGNLTKHMRAHTGEKPYTCNSCDYASSRQGDLKKHMRCHTGEKPYKCDLCDYTSSQQSHVKIHIAKHTTEKRYKCKSCDYASSRQDSLKVHIAKHTTEKPFKCNCCNYTCSQKPSLKIHMRSHTGEKPYKCDSCEYASSQKCNLQIHMRHHTGEKTYKCNSCDYTSYRKDPLKIHMRNHTGEKPYICNSCDYASSQKGSLKIHMTKHTGEKPYKCNSCEYASSRQYCLKIHMAKHTAEKPYKCKSCNYASSRQDSLKIHMTKHTTEKPFKYNL